MWAIFKHIDKCKRSFLSDRSGNIAIMSALAFPVILGVTGLAVDYNNLAEQQVELQRASDIAVLSSVSALEISDMNDSDAIIAAVSERLIGENLSGFNISSAPVIVHDPENETITVNLTADVDNLFGGIIRPATSPVSAHSVVEYDIVTAVGSSDDDSDDDDPNDDDESLRPSSVMFVLDASGSMNATYGGTIDNNDGRYPSSGEIRRRDVLSVEVGSVFNSFDNLLAQDPEAHEKIRTGVMAFNRGIFNSRSSDLQAGWATARNTATRTQTSNFTLPATAFQEAMDQLNNDAQTNASNARKIIVFMGDGELDDHQRIFYPEPESEILSGLCTQAKNDGIEVYVSTLDLDEEAAVDIYRQCASANGSVDGYTQELQDIDTACVENTSFTGRATCAASKSDYFVQTESAEQLRDFFQLTPETISQTPSNSGEENQDTQSLVTRLIR